ncbi:unnamed protein product [Schistocephalus solidus]|uniref:Uncharacterized protein n=1 Tax=Schistocephalus solidus TaxID=70667 RepID=A0A183TE58_SCHSO|nr:unnamed protein product [Schistocephalus solidus]
MEPFGEGSPESLNSYARVITLFYALPKIDSDFKRAQRSPVTGVFARGEMTIPRPPRHYRAVRPLKTARQTILLSPSFLSELQTWRKNNARAAPIPEIAFSTVDDADSCGITTMLTTNASAASDALELSSPAAICYPCSLGSRRKPSLQVIGKSLRIIDNCPVLIVHMARISRKMPALIIAPDGKSDDNLFQ